MKRLIRTIALLLAILASSFIQNSCSNGSKDPLPVTPRKKTALFNGQNYNGWTLFINKDDDFADPADQVFTIRNGAMHITGKGFGGCMTKKAYKDYHLSMEFRYVGDGIGPRAGKAADGGLLYHCIGEEKAYKGRWNLSFECNIIQGRCADLIVVGNESKYSGILKASAYVDSELRWSQESGTLLELVDRGRVNNKSFDPDWKDSESQATIWPEKPYGEWNRIDLICNGDTAEYILNGETVLKIFGLHPSGGRIQLQSECHAIEYRNIFIEPVFIENNPEGLDRTL